MVSLQIQYFSILITILLYLFSGVIFLVPVISLNFYNLEPINYTCDWNERVQDYLKTARPTLSKSIEIWVNQTGYFDEKDASDNHTLDYNELINYWDSLPRIEVDDVPRLIVLIKVVCVRNESLVRFTRKRF